jgi:hypothetical protein
MRAVAVLVAIHTQHEKWPKDPLSPSATIIAGTVIQFLEASNQLRDKEVKMKMDVISNNTVTFLESLISDSRNPNEILSRLNNLKSSLKELHQYYYQNPSLLSQFQVHINQLKLDQFDRKLDEEISRIRELLLDSTLPKRRGSVIVTTTTTTTSSPSVIKVTQPIATTTTITTITTTTTTTKKSKDGTTDTTSVTQNESSPIKVQKEVSVIQSPPIVYRAVETVNITDQQQLEKLKRSSLKLSPGAVKIDESSGFVTTEVSSKHQLLIILNTLTHTKHTKDISL